MKVRDLMTPNPACAEPDTTVQEIATLMKEEDIGCVPVLDEDGQAAGVITDRDIVIRCVAEGKDPSECRADDVISPQSVTINPNADAEEAARLMAERQIRRLAVVENGKLVGMLSLGDVAVKEHDDRLSGDVLHEVSEGVKTSSDAGPIEAHQGGSRSGVKTSIPDRADGGHSSSEKTPDFQQDPTGQQERRRGRTEDARPSAFFDSEKTSEVDINGRGNEETRRHEKVIPFRGRGDGDKGHRGRVTEGHQSHAPKGGKKVG